LGDRDAVGEGVVQGGAVGGEDVGGYVGQFSGDVGIPRHFER
jgi:hypothetical protein